MHARDVALTVGAALVALGGVYLFLEVRDSGAKPPSADAIEEARLRHARASGSPGTRPALARDPQPGSDQLAGEPLRPRTPTLAPGAEGEKPLPDVRGLGAETFRRGGEPANDPGVNPDLDAALLEANKAYDRKDFETARATALKLLQDRAPGNVRMLRVVVSSSCVMGDADMATKYVSELPDFDKGQMTARCAQYGITLQ